VWWRFVTKMMWCKVDCPELDNEQTVPCLSLGLCTATYRKSLLQVFKSLTADVLVEWRSRNFDNFNCRATRLSKPHCI
jgi:hypothetical protein